MHKPDVKYPWGYEETSLMGTKLTFILCVILSKTGQPSANISEILLS